jgi:hypothetical protein
VKSQGQSGVRKPMRCNGDLRGVLGIWMKRVYIRLIYRQRELLSRGNQSHHYGVAS